MKPISIILSVLLFFVLLMIRNYENLKIKVASRLLVLIFVALFLTFVMFPDLLSELANHLGVGRGTDLLLYFLTIGFILFIGIVFKKFLELEREVVKLVRALSIERFVNRE
jgi:hypothetical protein